MEKKKTNSKAKNTRCPFREECERKCEHEFKELQCDYYRNNACGDMVIPEQEQLRAMQERADSKEREELLIDALPDHELRYISVDELFPHPDNPRKELGDLTELADSIRSKGVMQNLTAVPRDKGGYTVIIGHRRLSAAKLAGLSEVPCVIVEMDMKDQLATMLLENMQRSDLTVYEQSQGFQMMLDFGESIEGIAEKTGFSKATVRRRLKMAELDQTKLKEVSGRQISMTDLDRLSQIEDIGKRNELLESIGTPNFNMNFESTLRKQNFQKRLPTVKAYLRQNHANKIERSQTYYGDKYTSITAEIRLDKWNEEDELIPAGEKRKVYYYLDESFGTIRFFVETPKPVPVKRLKEEIEREKYVEDVRRQFAELTETAYELRRKFAEELRCTSRNERQMLEGAAGMMAAGMFCYLSNSEHRDNVFRAAGFEYKLGGARDEQVEEFMKICTENPVKMVPALLYNAFTDRKTLGYYTGYSKEFPHHQKNHQLDALYRWLVSCGYELSDDERMLQDGTHPLFVDKDKKEN